MQYTPTSPLFCRHTHARSSSSCSLVCFVILLLLCFVCFLCSLLIACCLCPPPLFNLPFVVFLLFDRGLLPLPSLVCQPKRLFCLRAQPQDGACSSPPTSLTLRHSHFAPPLSQLPSLNLLSVCLSVCLSLLFLCFALLWLDFWFG